MIRLKSLQCLSIAGVLLMSQGSFAHELSLRIDKIKSNKGVMLVALHNNEANYNTNGAAVAAHKLAIEGAELVVDFGDLPEGTYAIKLYQDENENGQIDKSFMGIPTEGYGFSNNGGAYGPSSFEEASFTLDKSQQVEIHLR